MAIPFRRSLVAFLAERGGMPGAVSAYPKICGAGFPACLDSLGRLPYTLSG